MVFVRLELRGRALVLLARLQLVLTKHGCDSVEGLLPECLGVQPEP